MQITPPGVLFSANCLLAMEAARQCGQKIMAVYESDFNAEQKDDGEPVTQADIASNEILKKVLSSTGYQILSEESPDTAARIGAEFVWIVDPLDGTQDFIKRTGDFSVLIALVQNQKPVLGVVYQPTTKVFYVAEFGRGAYELRSVGVKRLAVSQIRNLEQAQPIVSLNHLSDKEKFFLTAMGSRSYVQKGSVGLKTAVISAGEADFYFTTTSYVKQWDTAAANCLISEAGGKMTDLKGNDLQYNIVKLNHENGVLVSNGKIHDQIIKLINS